MQILQICGAMMLMLLSKKIFFRIIRYAKSKRGQTKSDDKFCD